MLGHSCQVLALRYQCVRHLCPILSQSISKCLLQHGDGFDRFTATEEGRIYPDILTKFVVGNNLVRPRELVLGI